MKKISAKRTSALLLAMVLAISFSGVSFAAEPGPAKTPDAQKMDKDNGRGTKENRHDNRDRVPGQEKKKDRQEKGPHKSAPEKKDKGPQKGKPDDKKRERDKRDVERKVEHDKKDDNKKRDDRPRPVKKDNNRK